MLKHTLDERLAETVTGNKARELSLKIEMAEELLLELAKETTVGQGTLQTTNHRHLQCLMPIVAGSCNTDNMRPAKEFIKGKGKQ